MTVPDLTQKDRVALVTGGRQGLGRAMALAFAEAGADVAVCDVVTDDGRLDAVAGEIRGFGRRAVTVQADVRDKGRVEDMVKKVVEEFGRIDVLVNNAGVAGGPILGDDTDGWERVLATTLRGSIICTNAVLPTMISQKNGCIINLSSVGAYMKEAASFYSLAKSSIVTLTRGLGTALGQYNIRVNAVAPGLIRSDMTRPMLDIPELVQAYIEKTPLGRIGEPEDVAHVVLFLASDGARFVTGQTLLVDGGMAPMELPRLQVNLAALQE